MAEIKAVTIFRKLDSVGYKSFEAATVAAKMAGNPCIDVVHVLNQILTLQDSDLHHILTAFGVNPARLASDMTTAIGKLPRGAGGQYVDFSERVLQLILKKEEVPAAQLGKSGRLGWSTWTKAQPLTRDADNLILNPLQN